MYRLVPYLFRCVGRDWIYVSLYLHHLQCLSVPHPMRSLSRLTLPHLFLKLKCLMETGEPHMRPATSICIGEVVVLLHNSTPLLVHLLCHYRLPLGGKGQAKDLKQALLGKQPKYFIAFEKKNQNKKTVCHSSLALFSSLRRYWSSPTLGLFNCPFH